MDQASSLYNIAINEMTRGMRQEKDQIDEIKKKKQMK